MIDIRDVEAAAARLDGIAVRTPLIRNHAIDEIAGGPVFIKPECLQVTGSFKIRGAYNFLSQLTAEQAQTGVVTFSSGNHAQGVAAAGAMLGIRTTIVMPEDAPRAKLDNTKRLGGEVVTYDRYTGDREAIARDIAARRGAVVVPSYDHDDIIAGQGTVGLEIARELQALELTLAVGQYAIAWHVPEARGLTLTETVRRHDEWGVRRLPMPHPSPRNNLWLAKNPWFEADVVPVLKARVAQALGGGPDGAVSSCSR